MTEPVRAKRSARQKSTKSYRVQDQYNFLDKNSDDEDDDGISSRDNVGVERGEDEDDFVPQDQDEQEDPDEFLEDEAQNEQSEQSSGDQEMEYSEEDAEPSEEETGRIGFQQRARVGTSEVPISSAAAGVGMRPVKPFAKHQGTRVKNMGVSPLHSRGVDDWARRGGLEVRLKDLFGSEVKDLTAVLQTKDHWMHQETLPSRKGGSLRRSFYVDEASRVAEVIKFRQWYASTGSKIFLQHQHIRHIRREEADIYLANDGPECSNILLGAIKGPQLHSLKKAASISTALPFAKKDTKRGWILNLGTKIVETQWASNEDGNTQYLAVSVEQAAKVAHRPMENPRAPAFTATDSYPASIQIWAFRATKTGELDPSIEPQLALVICTDWGSPRHFQWCPVAASEQVTKSDLVHLGLLAGVWSDGKVKILDVSFPTPKDASFETQYMHFSKAAFDVQLPNTIASCLQWLSPFSLAAGTAAGMLGVWTLNRRSKTLNNIDDAEFDLQPWFYKQLTDTYMLTVASGYPSLPSYVSITGTDGYGRLFDLRSPTADCVSTARGRIFATIQAWHEHTQSFLMPDENYLFRNNTVRRYYTNIYSLRVESQIVCCASSPVQPGVLIGCADGMVTSSNPVPKILNSKEIPWQQIWFTHEWRPSVDKLSLRVRNSISEPREQAEDSPRVVAEAIAETTSAPTITQGKISENSERPNITTEPIASRTPRSADLPEVLSAPLARFNEGYRVQQINMQYLKPGKARKDVKEQIKYVTIYEEPSAVTSLAWNPNLKFGTWAVAGMGDGLLRVEDLGV
ncbi:hypothetical protein BU24DRAFT_450683 [Aaosphaeria arxii CBS 175.79]|uniref:Transcription factor tfiiic complex subunit tfc6 n=1 Tax=Aaosphaeria arxii CBS 175.79 TaxID=1450172 RepID=A0A6A5XTP0_9PLEO|nr:uncharacterized protein BU24DRAFT_450683 [Aaosphaeria arxii CBS 175.79]KAF2016081.1 hypothetical protein BU24DRAFT_450683 [Aaosphaeria arxii CBS 175.79]